MPLQTPPWMCWRQSRHARAQPQSPSSGAPGAPSVRTCRPDAAALPDRSSPVILALSSRNQCGSSDILSLLTTIETLYRALRTNCTALQFMFLCAAGMIRAKEGMLSEEHAASLGMLSPAAGVAAMALLLGDLVGCGTLRAAGAVGVATQTYWRLLLAQVILHTFA